MTSQFWQDLQSDMQDPEFARAYAAESIRIGTIDSLVSELDSLRETAGLSKAQLARSIGSDPSVVRRLLSSSSVNPTLGTLAEVAAVLGMKITLAPMDQDEQKQIMTPLRATLA